MELLERETYLAALTAYAAEARAGQARLVLLGGEAGVGKTTLVEEFRDRLPDATWAWGSCDGLFTPRPLSPLFDIAWHLGGALQEACARNAAREDLFDEFVRTLDTSPDLIVVVIEDLHWADAASLDLIRHAWRRLSDARALIVVTYRDDGLAADTLLRTTLGDLATYHGTRRLELNPLTVAAVARLAEDSALAPDVLHRLTGGNPFFLSEVLAGDGEHLPPSARDAVLARTTRLDERARAALEVVSLFRSQAEPAHLLQLANVTSEGLDGCVASGLLVARGNSLGFRHDIARLAIACEVAPHRRIMLHAQILAVLQELGSSDDAELAHHADEAGDRDAMAHYAPRAARAAAAVASHPEAAFQYARALRGLPEDKTRERAELCAALSDEAARLDRWEECLHARQEALDIWRALGDDRRTGDALRRLMAPFWRLGRGAESDRAAADAVRLLETLTPGPELAGAWLALAGIEAESFGRVDEALALTLQAHALALRLDLADVLVACLATEAGLAFTAGSGDAVERYRTILDQVVAAGDDATAGWIQSNFYVTLAGERRLAEADVLYRESVAFCDARDLVAYSACLHGERCRSLAQQGRIGEGLDLTSTLLGRAAPSPVNRLNPLIADGILRARVGQQAGAETSLDEALALALTVGEHNWTLRTRMARAENAWLLGRDPDARAEVALARSAVAGLDPWQTGEALAWARRLDAADPALDAATVVAVAAVSPYSLELRGDHAGAAAEWERLGSFYDAAMALAFSPDEADVRAAHDRFVALGADAAANRVRRRLRELGARTIPAGPRSATKQHPAGLTRREAEILELLVDGRTNAEVAATLVLSERTIDHHVSAILRKLKVESRAEAARQARQLGLVEAS